MTPVSRPAQPARRPAPRRSATGAGAPAPASPVRSTTSSTSRGAEPPAQPTARGREAARETSTAGDAVTTYSARRRVPTLPVRPAVVSSTSADRFAERSSARRRLLRRQVSIAVAGVLGVGVLAWLLLMSPVLALDPAKVVVQDPGTVVVVADVRAVVAAHAGTPLPRLDTVALRNAILEVPGVRSAKVTRAWPHGLVITLVSREPVAAIPDAAGGVVLRDSDGVQVGRADAAPAGLPVVTIPAEALDTKRTLTAVLSVLESLPADLRTQVAKVAAGSPDTVTMDLRDGAHVVWGSGDQAALKIAVLQALRAAPASAHAAVFDVSAPTLPITK